MGLGIYTIPFLITSLLPFHVGFRVSHLGTRALPLVQQKNRERERSCTGGSKEEVCEPQLILHCWDLCVCSTACKEYPSFRSCLPTENFECGVKI